MNNTYRVYLGFHFHAENELLTSKLASAFDSLYGKKRRRGRAFLLPGLTQFWLIICKLYIKAHQTVRSTQIKPDLKDTHTTRPSREPISAEIINQAAIVSMSFGCRSGFWHQRLNMRGSCCCKRGCEVVPSGSCDPQSPVRVAEWFAFLWHKLLLHRAGR